MLRSGLIATKIGNTSYFQENGINTHVTVLKIDECVVTNIKTTEQISISEKVKSQEKISGIFKGEIRSSL